MGLRKYRKGNQPIRVPEGHMSATPRLAAGEFGHQLEEYRISRRHSECQSRRIAHAGLAEKCFGVAEFAPSMGQPLPERPGSALEMDDCGRSHRAERQISGLRAIADEHFSASPA